MKLQNLPFIILVLLLGSCDSMFIESGPATEPERNFEIFWNDVDKTYPFFAYDGVNWDSMYVVKRPLVNGSTTDADLFNIFKDMLAPLLDRHISLIGNNGMVWSAPHYPGYRGRIDNTAINDRLKSRIIFNDSLIYGFTGVVPGVSENILYYNVRTFDTRMPFEQKLDSILKARPQVNGIIIDIRDNGGGFLDTFEKFAGLFFSEPQTYAYQKNKIGPRKENFTDYVAQQIYPNSKYDYVDLPVRVLTNRFSFSAAERFRMAMGLRKNTIIIGDTTGGALSPIFERQLPNGIKYIMVGSITFTTDYVLYEKKGLAPAKTVRPTPADLAHHYDPVLDAAIKSF